MFGEFTQVNSLCCNRNLDCTSLCCLEKLCVAREPCPNYDGSIEVWEDEQFNKAIDEEEKAKNEVLEDLNQPLGGPNDPSTLVDPNSETLSYVDKNNYAPANQVI